MPMGMHPVVRLRRFDRSDFIRLMGWIDSYEALVLWAGPTQFIFPLTVNQLHAYCAESEGDSPQRRIFTASDEAAEVCGHIELGAIDRPNETATLCRMIVSPDQRGKGLCAAIVRAALRYGFEEMRLRRIELRVYSQNISAIRCYESAGFVKEGRLRQARKVGDTVWDTVLMGILREEWNHSDRGRDSA